MRRQIAIDPAALGFSYELQMPGATCCVTTNSQLLGATLRTWHARAGQTTECAASNTFAMDVLVTSGEKTGPHSPHFRGLRHLVIASFGVDNIFIFDLARRRVIATISEELAADQSFWDRILLPIAMGVLGPAMGVLPVHCACLAANGAGMLIAGASGAGKSTLSVALAQEGFTYISDDWTYLALSGSQLIAHGMSVPAKLLPDAIEHFPILERYPLAMALNQELAYELLPRDLGARVELWCEPGWFFFLERVEREGCTIVPASAAEARRYVESSVERLPLGLDQMIVARSAIIERVAPLSCWKLSYGGPPRVAVKALQKFLVGQLEGVPA